MKQFGLGRTSAHNIIPIILSAFVSAVKYFVSADKMFVSADKIFNSADKIIVSADRYLSALTSADKIRLKQFVRS